MRVVSAVILLVVVLTVLWLLPPWGGVAAAAVTAALAAGELAVMGARVSLGTSPAAASAAAATVTVAFVASVMQARPDLLGVVLLALVLVACLGVLAREAPGPAVPGRAAAAVLAPIYTGLPLGAVGVVHVLYGAAATTWLLAMIAVSDSAQYYCGRAFGRRRLAPLVSPGKTVEGAVGGVLVAVVVGAVSGPMVVETLTMPAAALLALLMVLAGVAGDLFESLVKRSVGVKDSSALIPGHGGVLDRIDSHLFAAPVFYVFLRYFA